MVFQRILVAADEDPIAAHAVDVGTELGTALGAQLALIFVVDPATVGLPDGGVPAAQLLTLAERDAKRMLAGLGQHRSAGSTPLEFVRTGHAAHEIVKAAVEWPADLIVIGSHGRGGLSRAFLGSVAEAVVRHAPCPVLVVRGAA